MRTKLDIAGFQKKQKEVDLEKVRDKVKHKRNMYKQNADKRRNVKEPVLKPGDFVKLRKPQAIGKGDPPVYTSYQNNSGCKARYLYARWR